jgi:hypothetical protein
VVEFLADGFLAAEALEKNGISFHLRKRNFHGHLPAVPQIRRPEKRGHAAARNFLVEAVMVEHISSFKSRYHFAKHGNSESFMQIVKNVQGSAWLALAGMDAPSDGVGFSHAPNAAESMAAV